MASDLGALAASLLRSSALLALPFVLLPGWRGSLFSFQCAAFPGFQAPVWPVGFSAGLLSRSAFCLFPRPVWGLPCPLSYLSFRGYCSMSLLSFHPRFQAISACFPLFMLSLLSLSLEISLFHQISPFFTLFHLACHGPICAGLRDHTRAGETGQWIACFRVWCFSQPLRRIFRSSLCLDLPGIPRGCTRPCGPSARSAPLGLSFWPVCLSQSLPLSLPWLRCAASPALARYPAIPGYPQALRCSWGW